MTRQESTPPATKNEPAFSTDERRLPFDSEAHPLAPNYTDRSAWAALPDTLSPAYHTPDGVAMPAIDPRAARVDVFYVHPTTFLSKVRWNQTINDAVTNASTDASVVARQASAFNACGLIYAPRYRQAAAGSVVSDRDGSKAFDLAYGDVKRAFLFYLAHYNRERPFVLVGHSQGALHIYRLLEELVDGKRLQEKLVAAYTPGVPIALGEFNDRFMSIKPCLDPSDTHCVVSWNAFAAGSNTHDYLRDARAKYAMRHAQGDATPLCINPLTFDVNRPDADATDNLGALPGEPTLGRLPAVIPLAVGARCEGGILMVDAPPAPFVLQRLPSGSLHYHEIDLFYANIRRNALDRVDAFLAAADQASESTLAAGDTGSKLLDR